MHTKKYTTTRLVNCHGRPRVRAVRKGGVLAFLGALLAGMIWLGGLGSSLADSPPRSMSEEYFAFGYGKEHGLPDNQVRDILQTRDGYLWILTQQVLARFDGTRFTVFDGCMAVK